MTAEFIQCPHCGERHREGSPDCLARWSGKKLGGKYDVGKVLGAGGMGAVHEAHRIEDGARVALKVLHPRYANDPIVIERFFREGRDAGAIDHPGVVRVFEVGNAEDGAPYIVMELLEGQSLHAEIQKRGRLSPAEAAGWATEALEALQAAHDRKIIHRDLKPANLFLAVQPDGTRKLKIVDFGLARVAREAETRLTKTGVVMGTVAYMSPEQIRDFKSIDGRSDVYAIGITLFEMLAGKTPLAGLTQPQAVLRIVTSSIERSPRALAPEVPEALDAIVQRSLAPTPDGRFASAQAMADALRALRLGEAAQGDRRTGPLLDARDLATADTAQPGGPMAAAIGAAAAAQPPRPANPMQQTQLAHTMLATDVRPGTPPPFAATTPSPFGPASAAANWTPPAPGRPFITPSPAAATPKKTGPNWILIALGGVVAIVAVTVVVVLVARSSGDEGAGAQPPVYPQQPYQQPGYPAQPQQPGYPQQPSYPGVNLQPLQPDQQQPPQQPQQPSFPASLTPQ